MDHWGVQAFENSIALGWVERLEGKRVEVRVRGALKLTDLDRELTLEESVVLVCAAEIVAACRGRASSLLPVALRKQLVLAVRPTPGELELARSGVHGVLEASPLREHFEARMVDAEWATAMRDLADRLGD